MKKLLVVVSVLLSAFAFVPSGASAYEFYGVPRFDHSCLTTDGSPILVQELDAWAAVSGVKNCGVDHVHPDIVLSLPSEVMAQSWANTDEIGTTLSYPKKDNPEFLDFCAIVIKKEFIDNPHTIGHEMGHCFGLGHSTDMMALMYANQWNTSGLPNADDAAGARIIFPLSPLPMKFHAFIII